MRSPSGDRIQNLGQFRQAEEWSILLDPSFFDSHRYPSPNKVHTRRSRRIYNAMHISIRIETRYPVACFIPLLTCTFQ